MPRYLDFEDQAEIERIEENTANWRNHRHEAKCLECKKQTLVSNLTGICNFCLMKKIYQGGIRNA